MSRKLQQHAGSQRGVALILVLGILVLVSALIVAFLSGVKTELVTSQSYAYGASTQQLADSVVKMSTALIQDAASGTNRAWASQPGMIRTYGTDGRPDKYYKLYSSATMIVDGNNFTANDEAPPVTWDQQQGVYTDLNSPVLDKSGTLHFPIIDPRAKSAVSGSSIEGFDYQASVNGVELPGADANSQRLPMPVRWLYVLQNGKIAVPDDTSNNGVVTFSAGNGPDGMPSASNPIVGRVAFWTDDESCKLNINTASEGTFWDRPWANTETEQYLATSIPAQNEFQRFPGHPAKTNLSTVLSSIFPSPNSGTAGPQRLSPVDKYPSYAQYQPQLSAYYKLTPRVGDGGTRGGTVNENDANSNINASFSAIVLNQDRLYASVDELLYNPARTLNSGTVAGSGTITNDFLEKANFFLTAHNRAPELNLFNKPRITLWPLQVDPDDRTAKDKLIAFCSTINDKPYYFQRFNTYSRNPRTAEDPSSNTASSSQSAVSDWQEVLRNRQLYTYLDQLTSQPIPGYGGRFSDKYPNTRQQILTEMFDMIRSGVNQYSGTYNYVPTYPHPGSGQVIPIKPGNNTQGFGRTTAIVGAAIVFFRANSGTITLQVDPVGSGSSTYVVTSTGALISGSQTPDLRTVLNPQGVKVTPGAKIGATLILNPYTPSPGLPPLNSNLQYVISGFSSLKVTGTTAPNMMPLPFEADTLTNTVTARGEFSGGANASPFFGVMSSFRYARDLSGVLGDNYKPQGTNAVTQYPLTTRKVGSLYDGVAVNENDTTFNFSGGTLTVDVYAGADLARENRLQTIKLSFPAVNGLLVPTVNPNPSENVQSPPDRGGDGYGTVASPLSRYRRQEDLFRYFRIPGLPGWMKTGSGYNRRRDSMGKTKEGVDIYYWATDITRGIEADPLSPAKGDLRVYAVLDTVPENYFRPCRGYDDIVSDSSGLNLPSYKYTNVQSLRDYGADNTYSGYGYDNSSFSYAGDVTTTPANNFISGTYPHFIYNSISASDNIAYGLQISAFADGVLIPRSELQTIDPNRKGWSSIGNTGEYRASVPPACANGLTAALTSGNAPGDWDNMTGILEDGAFINKPDEGNSVTISTFTHLQSYETDDVNKRKDMAGGYFAIGFSGTRLYQMDDSGTTSKISTYSPNRQVFSPVMFGSLPTGINPVDSSNVNPWQTLLFCANPAAGTAHPGFASPPDWLLLDLFTMPIVEPYAISEPFSTAGKVNMNYQIMPFSYIHRSTAVRAVLKSTRLMAIPQSISTITAAMNSYKDGQRCLTELRYNINPDENTGTLRGFEKCFANGDIFKSAAEICSINLVPKKMPQAGLSNINMQYPNIAEPDYDGTPAWWNNFKLTGDNTREFPYGDIYARLTTKSNTYTVHLRVQTLKKSVNTRPDQWVEGQDSVVGEYRGSTTVERYIDVNDPYLPDFATSSTANVESYYKIHVINTKKFQF
ncbi:MAG: Verru_Chthon cassette protein A [Verrucomicrobiales bacterium]|jgi:uncharacterized protein (TIGR02600 family)|nr:Verru_Chthon cassette protein A [Verrucomicrobiales bacterium]